MKCQNQILLALLITVFTVAGFNTANACTNYSGDYVWLDSNWNGLQDDGLGAGINGVMVIFYRDFDCNGLVDGGDVIYDYQFTRNDADGNPGWYLIQTQGNACYVAEVNLDTVAGLYATTDVIIPFPTTCENELDIDFGFSFEEKPQIDFTCPKTIGFWKQQVQQTRAAKYTQDEITAIEQLAVELTPVFGSVEELETALLSKGNAGPLLRAKRQFAGVMLNLAAYALIDEVGYPAGLGEQTPLDLPNYTDAETIGEAIAELEYYILHQSDLGLANDLADAINNGLGLDLKCEF